MTTASPTAPSPAIEAFLRSIPLFAYVEAPEMMDILRLLRQVILVEGEVLFQQGDPGNAMWVLGEDSEVSLSVAREGREPLQLTTLGAGETVGEMALIDDAGRSATATVISAGMAHRIEAQDFDVLRSGFKPAAFKVLRKMSADMCHRLRLMSMRIATSLGGGRAPDDALATFEDAPRVDPAAVDGFSLFKGLPATVRLALAQKLREKWLPKGAVVVRHGDPGDAAYVLVEGEVAVQRKGKMLARLLPGGLFGLVSAIDGGSRSASCVALTDVRVWRLEDRDFDWLFQSGNRFAFQIVDIVARQLVAQLRQANATVLATAGPGPLEKPAQAEQAENVLTQAEFDLEIDIEF